MKQRRSDYSHDPDLTNFQKGAGTGVYCLADGEQVQILESCRESVKVDRDENKGKSVSLRPLPSNTEPTMSPAMAPSIPNYIRSDFVREQGDSADQLRAPAPL